MTIDFTCQLDWATGCPGIGSSMVLGVSVGVFLDEMNVSGGRLSGADGPPQRGWASPNQAKARIKPKGRSSQSERLSPACLPWHREVGFPLPSDSNQNINISWLLSPPAFRRGYTTAVLVPGPPDSGCPEGLLPSLPTHLRAEHSQPP